MNFLSRYKKIISFSLMVLSTIFFLIFFLKNFYISAYSNENLLEYPSITQFSDNEKKLIVGQKKALNKQPIESNVKAPKAETKLKPEQQRKNENITRKTYIDGMLVISIPKIKVRAGVMNGTTKKALKKGPGLYENSPLPENKDVNVCIAAHRNAYGQWFRNVDKLSKGDEISLVWGKVKYIYLVEKVFIVEENDWSITLPTEYSAITLTSCHPLKPPYKRIVVRGKLKEKIEISEKR